VRRRRFEQNNWVLYHENAPFLTSFFTKEYLAKSNMTIVPNPSYFSLFPRLKITLKGRNSDLIEIIQAESQMVLSTFTEHDFLDALKKNGISAGNGA
jgi:hypothetical protein